MGINGDLMRMLEPAARPDGVNGIAPGKKSSPNVPFEQQSFEMMLEEAGQGFGDAEGGAGIESGKKVKPYEALGGLNQVHNASLANLIAKNVSDLAKQAVEEDSL